MDIITPAGTAKLVEDLERGDDTLSYGKVLAAVGPLLDGKWHVVFDSNATMTFPGSHALALR